MVKLSALAQQILNEQQSDKEIAAMDAAMGNAIKTLAAGFDANKDAIEQEVEKTDLKVNEALGAIAILGVLLALPKVVQLIASGVGKLASVWKKLVKPGEAKGNEEEFAKKIIEFSHKWHKAYINGIKGLLKLVGAFKKAGIQDDAAQTKAAEVVYYTIIAGLAVYSGVGAVSAFKSALTTAPNAGNFSIAGLESAMAAIKSSEAVEFMRKIGVAAS